MAIPSSSAAPAARTWRRALLAGLTAGLVLATGPSPAAAAPAPDTSDPTTAAVSGTVRFREADPDRTVEVHRRLPDGSWWRDPSLTTSADAEGSYTASVPAGVPVKLRVTYGSSEFGYWYGDGFSAVTAVPVTAEGGETLTGVDLDVPAPAYVSGRLTDRSGAPVDGFVTPLVNNDGGLRPLTDEPVVSTRASGFDVVLPAGYVTALLGSSATGISAWLGGGSAVSEPSTYLVLDAGERRLAGDLALPVGAAPAGGHVSAPAHLEATRAPVVRGPARRGSVLRATAGRWSLTPEKVHYRWLRDGTPIRGARSAAYRLTGADVGTRVRVRVTASRADARPARAHSVPTPTVRGRAHR